MLLFAFPGMGKTKLAQAYRNVVDLEMSEIKYDNTSVQHLSKEERKAVKRPIKDKHYKQVYIRESLRLHGQGKVVLVALNFLFPLLWVSLWQKIPIQIYIPHPSLKKEYRRRYQERGNNARFIFEVMLVWYPTLFPLWLFSKFLPRTIIVTKAGQTLEDYYCREGAWFRRKAPSIMKINEN